LRIAENQPKRNKTPIGVLFLNFFVLLRTLTPLTELVEFDFLGDGLLVLA
jgi:hypothetical protein